MGQEWIRIVVVPELHHSILIFYLLFASDVRTVDILRTNNGVCSRMFHLKLFTSHICSYNNYESNSSFLSSYVDRLPIVK